MFGLSKKSPADAVKKQFLIWHDACMMFVTDETEGEGLVANKKMLDEPRPKLGACLFFIGSIDYLCQNYDIRDADFMKLADSLLQEVGYPRWLIASIMVNFCVHEQRPDFAVQVMAEGGQRLADFLNGKNQFAPYAFSSLVREWAQNPELGADELPLFEKVER